MTVHVAITSKVISPASPNAVGNEEVKLRDYGFLWLNFISNEPKAESKFRWRPGLGSRAPPISGSIRHRYRNESGTDTAPIMSRPPSLSIENLRALVIRKASD
ncbi:hypothetical protein EVAR_64333_1 [Eumeta japonica]|uniref:Uncharacterized protein n=1 Tax=Eumeta variegata TaxID=151549 RepID=A0A4C1ZD23_EUMVA|nr:hypothetical protein EVAR_64333_1 [Eumeta japonica]